MARRRIRRRIPGIQSSSFFQRVPSDVEVADDIRKRGFKKWYERWLIESLAYLVTGFLCLILVTGLMEQMSLTRPG